MFFFNQTDSLDIPEYDLKKVPISAPSLFNIHSFVSIDTTKEFKKIVYNYLYSRYLLPCENGFYIAKNSRIIDTWYQKIPLIKVMYSDRPKLLIADEVGLGKTIEAGLILCEMVSKLPLCRKLLILCPNNLVNKWEAEMRIRFDLFFDIYTGQKTIKFLEKWDENSYFRAILSYETSEGKIYANLIERKKWLN